MTKIILSDVCTKSFCVPGRFFRLVTVSLVFASLVACAVTPTEPVAAEPAGPIDSSSALRIAADMYYNRNYPEATRGFDHIVSDSAASANSRRLAHLGKALVYLSNDEEWHSVENAKLSLLSAGQVTLQGEEEFALETDLLMNAVSAVIGTESKYVVLQAKSGDSGAQLSQLKQERDALAAEREELLAEQANLHEALEKLKQLTLGN